MARPLPPGALRLALWLGLMAYCGGVWVWLRVDDLLHPEIQP
jgi:hypothetical protein